MKREIVMNALLMAVRRLRPQSEVVIHSDQGVQYISVECQHFMKAQGLVSSMNRRGNLLDPAMAVYEFGRRSA